MRLQNQKGSQLPGNQHQKAVPQTSPSLKEASTALSKMEKELDNRVFLTQDHRALLHFDASQAKALDTALYNGFKAMITHLCSKGSLTQQHKNSIITIRNALIAIGKRLHKAEDSAETSIMKDRFSLHLNASILYLKENQRLTFAETTEKLFAEFLNTNTSNTSTVAPQQNASTPNEHIYGIPTPFHPEYNEGSYTSISPNQAFPWSSRHTQINRVDY